MHARCIRRPRAPRPVAKRSLVKLARHSRWLARLLSARILGMAAQVIFLAAIHHHWPYSEIGLYLGTIALFSLSTLLFSSGIEKQLIRMRALGEEADCSLANLVGRIATYGTVFSLVIGISAFALLHPRAMPADFWAVLIFAIAGSSLRVFTAHAADHRTFVSVLDAQLNQAAVLRLILSAAVLLQSDALTVLNLELAGYTISNLLICWRYRLPIKFSLGRMRKALLSRLGMNFIAKLQQQLGVRFLLLIPAAQADFDSAGVFGMLQKVSGLVTSLAEFVMGRLHVLHGLFDSGQTLNRDYRRRARLVIWSTTLSVALTAAVAVWLGFGQRNHLLAFLLMLGAPPFQVWRAGLNNLITQRQAYWISPMSYVPTTVLMGLATLVPNLQPVHLSVLLLANVVLNVGTAKLLLRKQVRAGAASPNESPDMR